VHAITVENVWIVFRIFVLVLVHLVQVTDPTSRTDPLGILGIPPNSHSLETVPNMGVLTSPRAFGMARPDGHSA